MSFILLLLIFLLGSSLASFASLIAMRSLKEESIILPSSYCHYCQNSLSPFELIPVFSYLLQKGRSSCCNKPLPLHYLIMEIFGGLSGLLVYYLALELGLTSLANQVAITVFFTIIFSLTDLEAFTLPNPLMFAFFLLSLAHLFLFEREVFWSRLFFSILLLFLFLALHYFYSKSIGGGDLKLIFVFCVLYGFRLTLFIVFLASVLGILAFCLSSMTKRKIHQLPFAPFLFSGALISLFVASWFF